MLSPIPSIFRVKGFIMTKEQASQNLRQSAEHQNETAKPQRIGNPVAAAQKEMSSQETVGVFTPEQQ